MNFPHFSPGILLLVGFVAVGCPKAQVLNTEISSAAIQRAEVLGADQVPQAALHLQFAREELQVASDFFANNQKDEAESMLLRAEADAELAIALSQADAERIEAKEALARVRQLRADNPTTPWSAK